VLLLARYGDQGEPQKVLLNVSQEMHRRLKEEYVVQAFMKLIESGMHMSTDSRDLVLDATCESGAAAYVAEQWACWG